MLRYKLFLYLSASSSAGLEQLDLQLRWLHLHYLVVSGSLEMVQMLLLEQETRWKNLSRMHMDFDLNLDGQKGQVKVQRIRNCCCLTGVQRSA